MAPFAMRASQVMRVSARSAINLLPWRDLERARGSRAMVGALAAAILAGVFVMAAAGWSLEQRIEAQERRNRLLEQETAVLGRRVEEARSWRAQHEQLLARMKVIRRLRNSRPDTVRVFDALVNTQVQGVHYARVERRGQLMEVEGRAASNRLVSALMRNLESSAQFASAHLKRLREDPHGHAYGPEASTFEMTFLQVLPVSSGADGEGG